MAGDAGDIFHQCGRLPEDVVVNALEDIADGGAALVKDDAISIVDMAAAIRRGADEITGDLKLTPHGAHVVF